MLIVCIEGCHGTGKSEIISRFKSNGYEVFEECFMNHNSYDLHPQSLTMEMNWVAEWFKRIVKINSIDKNRFKREIVYFCDRSPYSAVLYTQGGNGELLRPVIDKQIEDMLSFGIKVVTINIEVNKQILWSRILHRLEKEPSRLRYGESNYMWMEETLKFYNRMKWDYSVDNTKDIYDTIKSIEQIVNSIIKKN
jgi:thymidylate kinase